MSVDWICTSDEKVGGNGADVVDVMLSFFYYLHERRRMSQWVESEPSRSNVAVLG